jgi:hypothetical protein
VDENQTIQDFQFLITSNQPIWFRASDGLGTGTFNGKDLTLNPIKVPPFFVNSVGELICWAVNAAGTDQVASNHLYGTAMVVDYADFTAYEYNSFNFTARGYTNADIGQAIPPQGDLKLSANFREFDACPQYLLFNFFAYGNPVEIGLFGEAAAVEIGKTDLTLVPCNQDLRQDRTPTCTKAKFDIWNENETKFTGAYQCFKCWFEGYLSDIGTPQGSTGGFGGDKFTYGGLHTTLGRMRVTGVKSTVCNGLFPTCRDQAATPLVGIISTQIMFGGGPGVVGAPVFGAGTGASSDILWDYSELPPEAPGR